MESLRVKAEKKKEAFARVASSFLENRIDQTVPEDTGALAGSMKMLVRSEWPSVLTIGSTMEYHPFVEAMKGVNWTKPGTVEQFTANLVREYEQNEQRFADEVSD